MRTYHLAKLWQEEELQDQRCKVLQDVISRGNDKYINGSKIVITDVSASNGTVHAIDKVMLATLILLHQHKLLRVVVYSKARTNILVAAVVRSD
jgi:hypothetical protein